MRWLAVAACLWSGTARAECHAVELSFSPAAHLQIAAWVEDASGNFVDTVYVTRATGALGLANRPGNARFKSAYRWPYGRRVMVLPVWAHRRNHSYGYVVMGGSSGIDKGDDSIGYHEAYSSTEPFYCSPSTLSIDATSCASAFIGSKGTYVGGMTSLYPPRADLSSFTTYDSNDARHYSTDNDLAAISGATPPGGALISPPLRWMLPSNLPDGTYTIFVEASLEGDFNASHNHPTFADVNTELRGFGHDIFGQPSIVYSLPVILDGTARTATSDGWVGYGAWDGADGTLHPADSTISDTPGSGAGRLAHVSDSDGTWRLKATTGACTCDAPAAPGAMQATPADTSITLQLSAPVAGARRYDLRYRASTPLDDSNFTDGIPAEAPTPGTPGQAQTIKLTGLKAQTLYYVGIRALNACGESSMAQFASATTGKQEFVTLHGCFIATAAWGSPMQSEVALLRRFRDRALLTSPLGRLFTAVYYTQSPPFAAAISADERLRGLARRALSPVVTLARAWLLFEDAQR
jgi:hypothetical protein